jgi:hypothetical protein
MQRYLGDKDSWMRDKASIEHVFCIVHTMVSCHFPRESVLTASNNFSRISAIGILDAAQVVDMSEAE